MKTLLKILLTLIAIPVVLFVVAAVVLVTIDLNDYKSEISQLVSEQTGRQLTVKGDLGKSFFPWLGVKIGAVEFSNAKGFGDKSFAAVSKVEVKIDTMSLLLMTPTIDRIILHGMDLNLAKNKEGKTNWDDLTGSNEAGASEQTTTPTPDTSTVPSDTEVPALSEILAAVKLGGLEVIDANVSWSDAQSNAHYKVKNVDFILGEVAYPKPLNLKLSLDFESTNPPLNTSIALSSDRIEWDVDKMLFQLKPFKLNVSAQGEAVGPKPVNIDLETDIKADLNQEQLIVSALQLQSLGLGISGNAQVNKLMSEPKFSSSLKIDQFNPRTILSDLAISLPPMANKNALSQVALNLDVNGDAKHLNVQSLEIKLDQTNIKTQASVNNFASPAISFDVGIDKINLDDYLPPKSESQPGDNSEAQTKAAKQSEQPLPIPVEMLRTLNVKGQLKFNALTVSNLQSKNITIGIKANSGVIDINPLSLDVAQGKINSQLGLDVTKEIPTYSIKSSIAGVQAAPLVTAVMGEDHLSGKLDLTAGIKTQGLLINEIKKQLNGDVKFRFANGAVKGFNLGDIIRKVKAKLKGENYEAGNAPLTTDFAELSGSAKIVNGVVNNKDLSAKSPLLRVAGEGKVDLTKDYLNYLATSYVVSTSKGQEGKDLGELKGLPIPIRLKGAFDKLDYKIDYGPIRKAYKAKFKKKVDNKKAELKKKLDAEKAAAKLKADQEKAEAKKKLEAKKLKAKKELEEKKAKEKDKIKKKLEDKLKKLF